MNITAIPFETIDQVQDILSIPIAAYIIYLLHKIKKVIVKPKEKPKVEPEDPAIIELNKEVLKNTKKPLSQFEKDLAKRVLELKEKTK